MDSHGERDIPLFEEHDAAAPPPDLGGLLRGLNPRYLSPEQVKDLSDTFGLALPEHGHDHT